jgi:DNA-binding MarR family transcriptional regulator
MNSTSSRETIYAFMFLLGLGLGMVMQVLILAVQNAVEYSDLGVATSGATLFRSMGGALGTAVLGAVFSNRLREELKSVLPAGAAAHAGTGGEVNPKQIAHLPPELHSDYLHAFTNSLSSVFLAASGIAVAAFVLAWFIRELRLRETVSTGDLGDTYAAPRDVDSLVEIVNKLGRLDRREGAREIVSRVAARAGVDLSPAACWLLARLSEDHAADLSTLAARFDVSFGTLTAAREELVRRHLIGPSPGERSADELTTEGHTTLERLINTGERRLSDLLEGWRPEEHEDLARMIGTLAQEFFIDAPALCGQVGATRRVPLPG